MCTSRLVDQYFLLALAFGPQFGSGFSGNLASFRTFEGGNASLHILNEAISLKYMNKKHIICSNMIGYTFCNIYNIIYTLALAGGFSQLENQLVNSSQDSVLPKSNKIKTFKKTLKILNISIHGFIFSFNIYKYILTQHLIMTVSINTFLSNIS